MLMSLFQMIKKLTLSMPESTGHAKVCLCG
jgi:hypothetical protein